MCCLHMESIPGGALCVCVCVSSKPPQNGGFLTRTWRKCAAAPLLTWRSEGHGAHRGPGGAFFPLN